MAKKKEDTSFDFGANTRKGKKPRGRTQTAGERGYYAAAYRANQHPRQTGGSSKRGSETE